MKIRIFTISALLAGLTPLLGGTRIIPVAGHLPGANGSAWTTDLSLTNDDSATRSVELRFNSDSGTRSRTLTLAPRESRLLTDAVAPDAFGAGNPSSWLGQLEVRSDGNVSASARIFTPAPNGGSYGSSYDSFDPNVLAMHGALSGLVSDDRYRTNVAYSNPSDATSAVTITIRRADGALLKTRSISVPAHRTLQLPLAGDVVANDGRVTLQWTASTPLSVVASVVDNSSNDPATIPSTPGASELFFPVVGRTRGAESTFWSTSLSLASLSASNGSVTMSYRDTTSGLLYTRTLPVAAGASLDVSDLNAYLGAPDGSGSLQISATVSLASSVRVFNTQRDGSTFGSSVLPQEDSARAANVRIKGVRRDSSYRLNVAISGASATTDGVVRLFDDRGREVETEPFHVEHGGAVQVSLNRDATEVRAGEVEVETHGGASVSAIASSVDNRTGDTSMRESEQENERQNELEIRLSAKTVAVGAPVTFTLGQSSGVQSVRWNFGDGGTASGLSVTHAYAQAGEFDVLAEITLTSGAIVRDREDVHVLSSGVVSSTAPIDFTWSPVNPAPGQQVTFTASRVTNGGTFEWKFPGDVRVNGNVATFTFATAGSFEVELELEHEGASSVEVQHVVTVGSGSGGGNGGSGGGVTTLDFSWNPSTPQAGQVVTFTASGGNGGVVRFKFPDGSTKSGSVVSLTFATAGSYEVEAEQEREGSVTLHAKRVVNVGGTQSGGGGATATSVDFSWSPNSPRAGQSVTFTASANGALPSGAFFKWRMPNDSRPTGTSTTYTFATAGTYEVKVQIERPGQASIEREKTITVLP